VKMNIKPGPAFHSCELARQHPDQVELPRSWFFSLLAPSTWPWPHDMHEGPPPLAISKSYSFHKVKLKHSRDSASSLLPNAAIKFAFRGPANKSDISRSALPYICIGDDPNLHQHI
jgi:hypothetical protein